MITRAEKEQQVKAITEKFVNARGAFIVDFKGMKVEQVTKLRKQLINAESEMKVVRNTLAKRAFKDHPTVEKALSAQMRGTNAIVFSYGEVNTTAKVLADFAKDVEVLQIKTGMMDGEALDDTKIKFLATLPGKNELRSMFLGTLLGAGNALARVLDAYVKKASEASGAPAGEAAPAGDAAPAPQA